jgi:ABC-2 type transport system permease protein
MKIISLPCKTLIKKEINRFLSVYRQTVITPVLSSFLYLFIFGYSLGNKINMESDFSYLQFVIPGLIIMGIINNSYQNTSSSIITSKFHGNIHDLLVAPISHTEFVVGYTAGALLRGMAVGLIIYLTSLIFIISNIHSLIIVILMATITSCIFGQFGIIAGILSKSFDELSVITNYMLMPLTYLGGVFYSINLLHPFFQKITFINPLFYMVDTFRYGFLGVSDINPLIGFSVSLLFCLILNFYTIKLISTGKGLRD